MEPSLRDIVKEFLAFIVKKMGIKRPFKVKLTTNRDGLKTYAHYSPSEGIIRVYTKGRGVADILRSTGHEAIHHFQNQNGRLTSDPKNQIPDIGGEIEDEANSIAGQLVKEFGYKFKDKNGKGIYEQ